MNNSDNRVEEEVRVILSNYLDVPVSELQPDRSLEELGADSLDFVEIVFEIEEKFGIESTLDSKELREKVRSIGDVLRLTADLVTVNKAQ